MPTRLELIHGSNALYRMLILLITSSGGKISDLYTQFCVADPKKENSMSISSAYQEIVDFIAAGTTPQNLIDFCPSEEAKERIADLIHREKTTGLISEETAELNHYLQLEHLMRLAKSRAQYYLKNE